MSEQAIRDRAATIDRLIADYEAFMHLATELHAPEFLEVGISMPQAKTLYLIASAGELHMSDLVARLGVSLSTVSGLVDRLVDAGWAARRDDPADRRQVMVTVTARGAAEIDRLRELNEAELRTLLQYVDDGDLPVLVHAIEILIEAAARAAQPAQAKPGAPRTSSTRAPSAGAVS